MGYELRKMFKFEAAHRLPNYDGPCNRLHGHSWVGYVVVSAQDLVKDGPKVGMVIDYTDLGYLVKPLVDKYLDHYYLNETLTEIENPTSEEIARWVYRKLKPSLPLLSAVIIEETCTSQCTYRED